MRKTLLLTGAAALAATAFSAQSFAADPMPIVAAPVTVAAYVEAPRNWTGGYVGGNAAILRGNVLDGAACNDDGDPLSYAWVTTIFGFVPESDDCADVFGGEGTVGFGSINEGFGASMSEGELLVAPLTLSGYSIGGQIGYLRQFGSGSNGFVVGGEVSANLSSASGILSASPMNEEGQAFLGIYSVRSYATATLRAGFALGPVLVYGEGGLAIAHVTYTDNIGMNASDMAHGYVYGGGIEGRISDNVTLFFEYNRIHLNDVTMIGTQLGGFLTTYMFTEVDLNVFKAGFNIHFGGN